MLLEKLAVPVPAVRVDVPSTPCVAAEKVIVPVGLVVRPVVVVEAVAVSVRFAPYATVKDEAESVVVVTTWPSVTETAGDMLPVQFVSPL